MLRVDLSLEEYVQPIQCSTEQLASNNNASTGVLDGILTVSADGKRHALVVVNKDPSQSRKLTLDVGKKLPRKIEGKVLSGASPDDYNQIGAENRVVPTDRTFSVKDDCVELPPHSLTVLRF